MQSEIFSFEEKILPLWEDSLDLEYMVKAIYEISTEKSEFTSDDLHAKLNWQPSPMSFGAAFKTAECRGVIEHTGRYTPSHRQVSHGRSVKIWKRKT